MGHLAMLRLLLPGQHALPSHSRSILRQPSGCESPLWPHSLPCRHRNASATMTHPGGRHVRIKAAINGNGQEVASVSESPVSPGHMETADIVERYFDCFNRRDLEAMTMMYAPDCVLHNLAYDSPAVGRNSAKEFVQGFTASFPEDTTFVIDDMTSGGSESVGVIWHMEIGGIEIPMGKGISFYKINSQGEIAYARECPEHFAKVAFAAPPVLQMAAPLLRGFAPLMSSDDQTQPWWELESRQDRVQASTKTSTARAVRVGAGGGQQSVSVGSTASVESSAAHDDLQPTIIPPTEMAGKWTKDAARSDLRSYDEALEMMGIKGIQKTTARLIDGIELSITDSDFTMRFLTIVPNFKVTEPYKFGREAEMSRRDLRGGWQRGTATLLPGGGVELDVVVGPRDSWGVKEVFFCGANDRDELTIESTVTQGDRVVGFTTVYTRGHV
ncbi:uncharacterized protein LOC142358241 [Convolutriloba macropyga]|uniref:uncharacterized protein LOC142358241 n=1 Tax=Convolutriloba macropyga TaxID=536237 RepID=UPI003F5258C3